MDRGTNWGLLGLSSIESFMENLLSQLTDDVGNSTWTPGCEHATRQLLCHATLPLCKNQGGAKQRGGGGGEVHVERERERRERRGRREERSCMGKGRE